MDGSRAVVCDKIDGHMVMMDYDHMIITIMTHPMITKAREIVSWMEQEILSCLMDRSRAWVYDIIDDDH